MTSEFNILDVRIALEALGLFELEGQNITLSSSTEEEVEYVLSAGFRSLIVREVEFDGEDTSTRFNILPDEESESIVHVNLDPSELTLFMLYYVCYDWLYNCLSLNQIMEKYIGFHRYYVASLISPK